MDTLFFLLSFFKLRLLAGWHAYEHGRELLESSREDPTRSTYTWIALATCQLAQLRWLPARWHCYERRRECGESSRKDATRHACCWLTIAQVSDFVVIGFFELDTLPKTNESQVCTWKFAESEKETIGIPTIHFQVRTASFREGNWNHCYFWLLCVQKDFWVAYHDVTHQFFAYFQALRGCWSTVDGRNPAPPGIYYIYIKPSKYWDKLPVNWL